ncbi:conserved hypothetical protein [Frankia canadensis]|uniref:Uncharacterized protein n=1 Tax=Frankia canadensis TaxID=1836972 RepID=A0A2I2L218_9ACTN|nr:hypothetical protein [Frankia canadensis]SNQ51961.1 conserved hypothetical protein [Frankia canadensis]SOU59251.1 conserved hypothetical protein [Frankia canadensis]
MTDYKIPRDLEKDVVTRIYTKADEAQWRHLQDAERTRLYQEWTEDPEIGGRLLGFVGQQSNIRPWLKDCPMKEYERARRGEGKYAKYVMRPAATLEQMVAATAGRGWEIISGTIQQKPMRARIREVGTETEERHFVAGPVANLKHLLWPAILDLSNGGIWPWTICVVDPFRAPVPPERREEHRRVANFLGVQVVYFEEM